MNHMKIGISLFTLFFLDVFYSLYILLQLRVYLRTQALDQMVQAASASAGLRVIKRVDQTLQDLGVCFLDINLYLICTELMLFKFFLGLVGLQCIFFYNLITQLDT
jgi:hypothetical protein